jgi:hypothetical protein
VSEIYLAGERAVEVSKFEDAEASLSDDLERERISGDGYYTESCLRLRAYPRIRLRKFALAKQDIDWAAEAADDDQTQIFWLRRIAPITTKSLADSLISAGRVFRESTNDARARTDCTRPSRDSSRPAAILGMMVGAPGLKIRDNFARPRYAPRTKHRHSVSHEAAPPGIGVRP